MTTENRSLQEGMKDLFHCRLASLQTRVVDMQFCLVRVFSGELGFAENLLDAAEQAKAELSAFHHLAKGLFTLAEASVKNEADKELQETEEIT